MSYEHQLKPPRTVLMLGLCLMPTLLLVLHRRTLAQTVTEHPYMASEDIKSATCLGCHPDKKEGKFVHTAVTTGCESCHQATSEKEKEKTTITLLAQGGELCAKCHEAKKEPVVHGPYKAGQCLVCHNPHTSNYPRQTRAATPGLCMSCHAIGQPDVKVSADAKSVSLLDGRTFDFASYQKAPKIGAEHPESSTPPVASDAALGKDPRKPDAELNCISCHDPHASKMEHLLHKATESRNATESFCLGCQVDVNAQVRKPVQHAAVDTGYSAHFNPKLLLLSALLRSGQRRISGPALRGIHSRWPKLRGMSRHLRTHFIGGRQ